VRFVLIPALSALSILISGCYSRVYSPEYCRLSVPEALGYLQLGDIMGGVAREFCDPSLGPRNHDVSAKDVLVVPDFVDLGTYSPRLTGMILGEVTRSSLSATCRQPIYQVDLSKDIKLDKDGVVALIRDNARIANREVSARWGYVGTYTASPGKLIISLRELDMISGAISRMVTREISYGCVPGLRGQQFTVSLN